MALKPANKYQLFVIATILTILVDDFRHHTISLLSKSFSNIVFANCKDQAINNSNIYILFDLLGRHKSIP